MKITAILKDRMDQNGQQPVQLTIAGGGCRQHERCIKMITPLKQIK